MPNSSLRAYLQRIETWIEESKVDKAISQSAYLIQQFPKNLNAFQVLSKALLQKQDFNNADKVFDIILQIEPDDFVSHIGKSIISEFNHSLYSAIEHMKYAFEIQPSNEGLQSELKRLLLANDGIEPNKILLTRGALIKMYLKGKLYQQAISEARIGISENPQRIDYKIAMAKSFFESGDLIQAVETCVDIISVLPYCLPANQILDQVLTKNHTTNNNGFYHTRLVEIDPYHAFMLPSTKSIFDIPDIAVMVDDLQDEDSYNFNLESLISAVDLNKTELEVTDNIPETTPDWESVLNSGIESKVDSGEVIINKNSENIVNSRKKIFLNKLKPSKSVSEDQREIPDWYFDDDGKLNQNGFGTDYEDSVNISDEINLESENLQEENNPESEHLADESNQESENPPEEINLEYENTLESNLGESGVFDTDIIPAINDLEELETSNTLWTNDEEETLKESNPKPVAALDDTQRILVDKENPSDLLIESAKALEGGNIRYAYSTLSKLVSKHKNLPDVCDQLETALELYPTHTEFRLLLGEAYLAMGEKAKSLSILQNAQKNITL